jgi:hypothetical protein
VQTDFAGTKVSATMTNRGLVENLVKGSSCGYANLAHTHTRITNSVTSANRYTSILAIMPILMVKNGFSANNVTSGFTATVK